MFASDVDEDVTDGTDTRVASLLVVELELDSGDSPTSGTVAISYAVPTFREGTESDESIGSCSFTVSPDDADVVVAVTTPFRP